MKNIDIYVDIEEKSLKVGKYKLFLHPSLIKAELSTLPKEAKGKKVLELMYEETAENFLSSEFRNIQKFLEQKNLKNHFDAYPCKQESEYPIVAIEGNFNNYILK